MESLVRRPHRRHLVDIQAVTIAIIIVWLQEWVWEILCHFIIRPEAAGKLQLRDNFKGVILRSSYGYRFYV